MLRPRIIPCLLVKNNGLVKTVKFGSPKYVGDPINAVKIFNEKEVDELAVFDIDATQAQREPDYNLIKHLAVECRMPLCYGGGIKTADQGKRVLSLGVEKIALSSAAVENPELITEIAGQLGTQSVVVVLDVKKRVLSSKYEIWTNNASKNSGRDIVELAKEAEIRGAGEIIINSIDNDGVMRGYDFKLIDKVYEVVSIPITVLGGAGSLQDIEALIRRYGLIGAAAGSLFVFKGAYKAVLINYPGPEQREVLYEAMGN